MGLQTATEKCRYLNRYVKRQMGMWTDLSWYYRIPLSPLYAVHLWWWCVKGVPVNIQRLHDEDYEPDEPETTIRCPECRKPKNRDMTLSLEIRDGDDDV